MLAPVSPVVSIFCDLCMMIIHDLGGPVILKLSNDEQPKGMPQDTRLADSPNKRMSQEQKKSTDSCLSIQLAVRGRETETSFLCKRLKIEERCPWISLSLSGSGPA